MPITQRPILLVFLIVLCTQLLWLGERDIDSRGEAREVLVAQSVIDGNWILPRGYGGVVASKPPLLHWFVAGISGITGSIDGFSVRLPSMLASLLFLIFFFFFLEQHIGRRTASLSVLLILASVEWYRLGIECRVDMLHSTLVAGSLLALYAWYEKSLQGLPILTSLLMAAATLTKGPVGIVLPILIFTVFLWSEHMRRKQIISSLWKIFIPAAILSGWWYIAALFNGGEEFLAKVQYENIARFTSTMEDKPHSHSFLYLLVTLYLGLLPWVLVITPVIVNRHIIPWVCSLYRSVRSTPKSFRWLRLDLRLKRKVVLLWGRFYEWFRLRASFERYALICVSCIFIFYSIPSGKRSVYLLPAYPFIAFLCADYILSFGILQRRIASRSFLWLCKFVIVLYAMVFLFVLGKLSFLEGLLKNQTLETLSFAQEQFQLLFSSSWPRLFLLLFPLFLSVFYVVPLALSKKASFLGGMLGLSFAFYLAFHGVVARQYSIAVSSKDFSEEIAPIVEDRGLYSFGNEFYAISFYLHKKMGTVNEGFKDGMLFVVYENKVNELESSLPKGLRVMPLLRSAGAIGEPLRHVLLVEVRKE
ncbi:MAG: hypothetical protein GYA55_06885 [SAR324 cluster bacterium]|uniref:Glycosyltransferase RgtA/B/C/D-like domain-containing protein n=1 Tax=SAR324 cluster bacterium TaxID=2024889 RepID=A0A7X9ILD3_9DELT|nr:hypothetical protein [SAR324 cluster bacterium]